MLDSDRISGGDGHWANRAINLYVRRELWDWRSVRSDWRQRQEKKSTEENKA